MEDIRNYQSSQETYYMKINERTTSQSNSKYSFFFLGPFLTWKDTYEKMREWCVGF